MPRINSCAKGKRVERKWRDVLRAAGYTSARRGQQFSGSPESPDVVCRELSEFHFEVKGVERLNIWEAAAQAVRDASANQIPVVAHKRNGTNFLVTLRAEDFIKLVQSHCPPEIIATENE